MKTWNMENRLERTNEASTGQACGGHDGQPCRGCATGHPCAACRARMAAERERQRILQNNGEQP